jgi:uncharacterized protein YegL
MSEPQIPVTPARRTLNFFWLVDCSGSMGGTKIASLNKVIREVKPELESVLSNFPEIGMKVGCIQFSDSASWHIGSGERNGLIDLDKFNWIDLQTGGCTATAEAIELLCDALDVENMPKRGVPPVCILISDGYYTDSYEAYESAIEKLNKLPWGIKAVRLVIAIGDESDYEEESLLKFSNAKTEDGSFVGVLKAHNPSELIQYIRWASTTATSSSSAGKSQLAQDGQIPNVVMPEPPMPIVVTDSSDVF